jgi:hypothetical protein
MSLHARYYTCTVLHIYMHRGKRKQSHMIGIMELLGTTSPTHAGRLTTHPEMATRIHTYTRLYHSTRLASTHGCPKHNVVDSSMVICRMK